MKVLEAFLSLGFLAVFWSSSNAEQQNFMLLAGPLKTSQTSPSDEDNVFNCGGPLPQQSRSHFQYLQSRGVTHFKVPLSWSLILPSGDPNQPHEDTVKCYKTLVQQLTESGIKPLLVLHRSAVPELFRARYGGWENPLLVQMFEQYAGLCSVHLEILWTHSSRSVTCMSYMKCNFKMQSSLMQMFTRSIIKCSKVRH